MNRVPDDEVPVEKPLLVGESPSPYGNGTPFSGLSGQRVAELMGYEDRFKIRDHFVVANLFNEIPEHWSNRKARLAAKTLLTNYENKVIILCGNKVGRAFGLEQQIPHFSWAEHEGRYYVRVPHPSARNRWYNYPLNVERARRFFSAYRA